MRSRTHAMPFRATIMAICFITIVSGVQAEERTFRRPLLEAAQANPVQDWQGLVEPGGGYHFAAGGSGWMAAFWNRHKWHFLTTFLVVETEYQYNRQVGTSQSPLLFGRPTGIDSTVDNRAYDDDAALNFVENNKTNLLHALALGSIFGMHEGTWSGTADDFMGLIEAEKFNTASTELVKQIVGRRRPALDRADVSEIGQTRYDSIQASNSGHLSFYSAATSEAFTYCSYLDRVVAHRLEAHRGWRIAAGFGFYGFAGYVGYTRLRQGEHYLTDVLAGAAAGTFVGRGFYKANHRDENSDGNTGGSGDEASGGLLRKSSRLHFSPPMPVPGGGMLSMTVEIGK